MSFIKQLKHAWNAFTSEQPKVPQSQALVSNPVRRRQSFISDDRSIANAVLTRIAVDISMIDFMHVDVDDNDRFLGARTSGLNNCLSTEANIDQSAMTLKLDIAQTLLESGTAAVVPVDTTYDPKITGGYDIITMRVGRVVEWNPRHVKVELYNDRTGRREQVVVPKENAAIIFNPLYSIMNEPNSTLQRLIAKLKLLDVSDENSTSNKLDLIIQLPYVIKSEQRRQQAMQRMQDIEFQLSQGDYGIAYTDGTEKINQLNRPVDNNLQEHIAYLTEQLYSQLGITKSLLEGSASEDEITNYYRRTVEPIAKAITEEFDRKFLTKTARSQKQKVIYMRSQFDFVTMSNMGDLVDKLVRNEVASSNEVRSILGLKPVDDPRADELRNKHMPVESTGHANPDGEPPPPPNVKMERS